MASVDFKPHHSKKALREQGLMQLKQLNASSAFSTTCQSITEKLHSHFEKTILNHGSFVLGAYVPIALEYPWDQYLQLKFPLKIAYPTLRSGEMVFCECSFSELVENNSFGVQMKEPPPGSKQTIPNQVLVPGICFNENKYRLGRGGGFYDRFFAKNENNKIFKIGINLQKTLNSEFIPDPWDIPMDLVVSGF